MRAGGDPPERGFARTTEIFGCPRGEDGEFPGRDGAAPGGAAGSAHGGFNLRSQGGCKRQGRGGVEIAEESSNGGRVHEVRVGGDMVDSGDGVFGLWG